MIQRLLLLTVLLWTGGHVRAVSGGTLTVFAAASLTGCLREVGAAHRRVSGDRVVFHFGASGLLRRQIEEGAPADVIVSADEATLDALEKKGLLRDGTRHALWSNRLVVVVHREATLRLATALDLTGDGLRRIAVGDPNVVPAGAYARDALKRLGVWERLQPRLVPCENVRVVLAAVESGNVDAGLVYRTDARIATAARVAFEIHPENGPRIRYPVAMTREARHAEAALRFLEFLKGPEATAIVERHGFEPLDTPR